MNVVFQWRAWLAVVIAAQLFHASFAAAQDGAFSEYEVKAAFLYNFGKFVEWPTNAFAAENAPLLIGVYGDNPFGNDLAEVVRNKIINGHPVITRKVSFSELKCCQILFISRSEQKNIKQILAALDGAGVLTVTEDMDPTQPGVMINFIVEDDRIRFEIDNSAAEKVGLKISSKLLILATKTTMLHKIHKIEQPGVFLCARFP
ncbi:MAG TPA: YfiR family protein [Candidatus Sulfotelmatobacter sp.]|nr:YfiR family protein [Candidatus Sulfotelmatobacter sp.]